MNLKTILVTLLFIVLYLCVPAQQKAFDFKNLTQDNGLPSNESYFVYRDSQDFLWFATDQGVVRYNGSKMERFELPDKVIFKIREDSKGRVWFFSHKGKLAYFYKGVVHLYKYNDRIADSTKNILILDAYITDDDDVIINSGTGENYSISKRGEFKKHVFYSGLTDKKNNFLITPTSATTYFTQALVFNIYHINPIDSIKIQLKDQHNNTSYNVPWVDGASLHYGTLWLNTNAMLFFNGKGIVKLNRDGSYKVKFFPEVVNSVTVTDGQVWVGFMKDGAVLLDADLNEVHDIPVLRLKSVSSIRRDHEGGMWFSTLENGIFYLKDPGISRLQGDSSLLNGVSRLCNMKNDHILYATEAGLYKLQHNTSSLLLRQSNTGITDLLADSNNNLIMSGNHVFGNQLSAKYIYTHDPVYPHVFVIGAFSEVIPLNPDRYLVSAYGTLIKYTLGNSFLQSGQTNLDPTFFITNVTKPGILFHDSQEQNWLGTNDALYRFDSVDISADKIFQPGNPLFRQGVTAMRQMDNGLYTIAIRFGGVVIMKDSSIMANITEKEGLLSNSIRYLLPVKDQLWVATAKGVSVISFRSYNPLKYSITNIGKNSGLFNMTIYQLMPFRDKMLAATSNGIYEINQPQQFVERKPAAIPFYINSISYYKGDTSDVNTITLPYKSSRAIIRYSAICFNQPEELKYYYRFDDRDTTWHEIASTELVMENLIPGTYQLEIKAGIPGEQRFSEIQKLTIIVEKPWWQNGWLLLLAALLVAGTIYLVYKNRVSKITAREEEKTALKGKMIELEQTALQAQMNPHFIFNCLTSIQQLVVSGNKAEANAYLVKFARLIRKTLELSRRPFITVEEETVYIQEYLVMEQLRIPNQFDFEIHIDKGINVQKTEIPNMMLQPVVENCIRHGIKHLDNKKGHITISLKKESDHILCTVTDNGVGRHGLPGQTAEVLRENKSYGINIVNKRLEILAEGKRNEAMFEIVDLFASDGSNDGTKVILRLPYKTR